MNSETKTKKLDMEWIFLMAKAKKMGLNQKQIRSFLRVQRKEQLPSSQG